VLALAAIAVFLCGCDDDLPPAPPVPAETEYVFTSDRYLNNRFFRLDLADPDVSRVHDVPGRDESQERIRFNSIQVFRLLPSGTEPQPEDIAYLAAYTDTTGVFWTKPGCPPNDFATPSVYGYLWREIVAYDPLLDRDGKLLGIDLRTELADADVLAVCYDVEDYNGYLLYRIGDVLHGSRSTEIPGEEGFYHRAKLLKAPAATAIHPFHYVFRNVYSLGRTNIDPESFRLAIEGDALSAFPTEDENGLPYIHLFGLDQRDDSGLAGPDGLVDIADAFMFDLAKGLLRFPVEEPFNAGEEVHTLFADSLAFVWDGTYLMNYQAAELYDPLVPPADYPQYGHFTVRAVYGDDPGAR
jgi:hypothetical protein